MAKMYETFSKLGAPRVVGRSSYLLTDILVLSVLAVICGADTYDAIEQFGKAHHKELKKILRLPHGIPSHDTINRGFQSINARHFERLFVEWVSDLKCCDGGAEAEVIAIDGKTMRGSKDTFHCSNSLHIVHAWSVKNAMCLGQYKTDDKNNEITAIPQLMEILNVAGSDHRRDGDTEGHSGEDSRGWRGLCTGGRGQPGDPVGGRGGDVQLRASRNRGN